METGYLKKNRAPILRSPFEQIHKVDADAKEWWNSHSLAHVVMVTATFCPMTEARLTSCRHNKMLSPNMAYSVSSRNENSCLILIVNRRNCSTILGYKQAPHLKSSDIIICLHKIQLKKHATS